MKPNIITDGLPKEVVIDDGKYRINWDFRIGMKFDEIMESEIPDIVKLEKLLTLYYPKYPNNLEEAVEKIELKSKRLEGHIRKISNVKI